jgi:hypothetical protein
MPLEVYLDWLIWMTIIKAMLVVRTLIDSVTPFETENAIGFYTASNEWAIYFIIEAMAGP